MSRNIVSIVAQTKALFSSGPRMIQMATPNKLGKCRNFDTLHLKRFCRCALCRCRVENNKIGTRAHKTKRILFSCCDHEESREPVREGNFEVMESSPWHTLLFSQ